MFVKFLLCITQHTSKHRHVLHNWPTNAKTLYTTRLSLGENELISRPSCFAQQLLIAGAESKCYELHGCYYLDLLSINWRCITIIVSKVFFNLDVLLQSQRQIVISK